MCEFGHWCISVNMKLRMQMLKKSQTKYFSIKNISTLFLFIVMRSIRGQCQV